MDQIGNCFLNGTKKSLVVDIPEEKWKNPRNPPHFIHNWNLKGKKRTQNAGVCNISKFASETATLLGLDE